MHNFKEFIKDLLKYIPGTIIPTVIALVSLPIFTRYIKPDAWGNYVLVLNTAELLTTITVSWLSTAAIRFYEPSLKENKIDRFVATVFLSGLLSIFSFSLLALIIFFIVKDKLPEEFLLSVVTIGIWLFAGMALSNVIGNILRAKRQAGLYSGFLSWQSVSRLGFGLLFVGYLSWGFKGLLIGSALGVTVGAIVVGFVLFRQPLRMKEFSWSFAKDLFSYGIPLVGGNISYWLLRLADRYILRLFRNAYEVGIYAVSYDLSDKTFGTLIDFLTLVSWPIVVQSWERHGEQKTSEFLTQLMRQFLLLCVPAVVAMSLLQNALIRVLADATYSEGAQIIPLVVLSVFFYGFQRQFQNVLALYKKTQYVMFCIFGGAVVNIVLNLILLPKYGFKAAAIVNLISYVVFALLTIIFSRRLMVWKFPFTSMLNSLIASGCMSVVLLGGVSIHAADWVKLLICVPSGLGTYLIALFVIKELPIGGTLKFVKSFFMKPEKTAL